MTKPEAEFGSWSTPQVPLTVEYPLEVMDEIRSAVCEGLQQLAHGGLELGGVMFGAPRDGSIRILTWRPISCEHAQGPSLRLSTRDRIDLARLLEMAKSDPDLVGLQPVGWFLSHTRSDIFLTASDLEIYNGFFPEPWQVTLVLRPTRTGPARAGFFARESDGSLKSDASYLDFPVEPLRILPPAERPLPTRRDLPIARIQPEPRKVARAAAQPGQGVEPPRFLIEKRRRSTRGRWLWAIPASLALVIAGVLVKEKFLPNPDPSFSFRAFNSGQAIQIEWDPKAEPIRVARQAVVDIQDGNAAPRYALTPDQLRQGKMTYQRQGGDVEIRMTVYRPGAPVLREFARLVGAATGSVASAPQAPPPEVVQLRSERDQSDAEVKRLTEELRKERVRADKLQEMIRILQNRIDVDNARRADK